MVLVLLWLYDISQYPIPQKAIPKNGKKAMTTEIQVNEHQFST